MNIGYLGWRGTFFVFLIWSIIISGIANLRGPHLLWSEVVTETQSHFTIEFGLIALLWFIGILIILCLYDWNNW